jgi:Holliday junction DNA helicase RuvA
MIGSLRGKVEHVVGQTVLLDVQGVGYEVHSTLRLIETLNVGAEASMVIYTDVNQDHIRLYGFLDQLEKQTFLLLLRVKGVGPKSSADIVSSIDCRELLRIVSAGDLARLQAVKGVGKKTAERIVVELRDKVGEFVAERHVPLSQRVERETVPLEDAVQALQTLGFIRKDAERAVKQALESGLSPQSDTGSIVKEALRFV